MSTRPLFSPGACAPRPVPPAAMPAAAGGTGCRLTFGSVCSGIEAASLAWAPLGWRCAWVSEIDPFASAVLAHRYPAVPNLGDFTRIGVDSESTPESVDVLVGGTPCQDFSIAGQREGLDGADGRLALEYMALVGRLRPRWLVWENVPGVLSQNGGWDFGAILGALAECGYGFAYRVLDAQFAGVPQRRRRVFLVGHLGDWRPPTAVLLERHSLSGHPAPRREAGAGVASNLGSISQSHRGGIDPTQFGRLGAYAVGTEADQEAYAPLSVASTLRRNADSVTGFRGGAALIAFNWQSGGDVRHEVSVERRTALHAGQTPAVLHPAGEPLAGWVETDERIFAYQSDGGRSTVQEHVYVKPNGIADSVTAARPVKTIAPAFAVRFNQTGSRGSNVWTDKTGTLNCAGPDAVLAPHQALVRRLTPRECERLMGLPDDWTLVPYRGKPATDTNRYRAISNSMAVPVVRWIGERIALVEALGLPVLPGPDGTD